MRTNNRDYITLFILVLLQLQLIACGGGSNSSSWPIAKDVYTTAEQQVLPVAVPSTAPHLDPKEVKDYATYGYSAWVPAAGLPHEKRTELAPGHTGAAGAAELLRFFTMSDVHITDKESPAQPIQVALSRGYGSLLASAYSPIIVATTHVLDAAVQTINSLHKKSPFSFGIVLGDLINNSQYNELRWFIDVMDGRMITPSSGAHAGADTIDYQMPYQAAGLDRSIPWYQVIGNHDQFWMGFHYENDKLTQAHIADTVLNMEDAPTLDGVNKTGAYMGVVDGSTVYGDVIYAGPEQNFSTAPTVAADPDRHTLSTPESSSRNWMNEFFNTTSHPSGHGFTQANLDEDFACYSFEPSSEIPLKVIVLDDTCKGPDQPTYVAACLDQRRHDWLTGELDEGQRNGKLMIIAAHIPILPQTSLTDSTPANMSLFDASALLAELHSYPNLILWISGHRHLNVVTPQPYNRADLSDHPEQSFWEVETSSLRDFPQQFRTFDIRRNHDNTLSIIVTNVDPAVAEGSPASASRGYAIGATRIFGFSAPDDQSSQAYNAELVKQLTPEMQAKLAGLGKPL